MRIVPKQRGGLVAGRELGGDQGVAEGKVAAVGRDDGSVGAGAVAEHDRHAVADAGVRGVGAVAPERDRVAVHALAPAAHADVEASALPSVEDLGGDGGPGVAEARAERRGRQRDRRAHPGCRAHVRQCRRGQSGTGWW